MNTYLLLTSVALIFTVKAFSNISHSFSAFRRIMLARVWQSDVSEHASHIAGSIVLNINMIDLLPCIYNRFTPRLVMIGPLNIKLFPVR